MCCSCKLYCLYSFAFRSFRVQHSTTTGCSKLNNCSDSTFAYKCLSQAEYFQHLLEVMERSERTTASRLGGNNPTSSLFEATIEERIQCGESKKVAYKMGKQNVIGIKIPIEAALNGMFLYIYYIYDYYFIVIII